MSNGHSSLQLLLLVGDHVQSEVRLEGINTGRDVVDAAKLCSMLSHEVDEIAQIARFNHFDMG